jgi:hypothetical protein
VLHISDDPQVSNFTENVGSRFVCLCRHPKPCKVQVRQEVQAPSFPDSRHVKVARLSALRTGRLYPPGNIPGTHFFQRLTQSQGPSASGRFTPGLVRGAIINVTAY